MNLPHSDAEQMDTTHTTWAAQFLDVAFAYPNGTVAVEHLSLDIPARSIVAVAGPSGCGKSTMLYLLAGLHKPAAGSIRWGSNTALPGRLPLAMVFQKDTVLPWLTVRENVRLPLTLRKIRSSEAEDRIAWLLDLASLTDFADAFPYQLSGGMRRRVAFLTAVAGFPRVLLLDEPFSSLDEPTRIGIHQDVLRVIRQLEMTAVLVTHDLAEALSLSDQVVILTKRPGTVATRRGIPFGRERDILKLRQDSSFLSLYGELWRELSLQMPQVASRSTYLP